MQLILIAAVTPSLVIGKDNDVVWKHPDDMARFRRLTAGHAVLMGRKTWESIPERFRPLPKRFNIILTRTPFATGSPDAICVTSIDQAIERAEMREHKQLWVIGGGEVYRATLEYASRLELTEIDAEFAGGILFPPYSDAWQPSATERHDGFSFVTYQRR